MVGLRGFEPGTNGYISTILPLPPLFYRIFVDKELLKSAIHSYAYSDSIKNFVDASNALLRELNDDGQKTFAKIIDEYNFMKFTRGMTDGAELWTESK